MQISLTITDGRVTPDEHRLLRAIVDSLSTAAAGCANTCRSELTEVKRILEVDRPDVGVEVPPAAAAAVFGSPAAQQMQQQHAAAHPEVPAAPSMAGAIAGGAQSSGLPAAPTMPSAATSPNVAQSAAGASTITEAAEAPNPTPPQVDARGLPWDARIHAGTKALNADGSWRARRGLNDPGLVKRVEDELRAIMAAPAVQPIPVPASYITPEAAATGLPAAAQPATVPQPPVAVGVHPLDFAGLMQKATALMTAQKLTREELEQCAQAVGLPSIVGAVTRVDLVPTISAHIDNIVAAKG